MGSLHMDVPVHQFYVDTGGERERERENGGGNLCQLPDLMMMIIYIY